MKSKRKGLISNFFKPSLYLQSFRDLNINILRDNGIKLFICDLDNTLAPHYIRIPSHEVIIFVNQFNEAGIKIAILSNNTKKRVKVFCSKLNVDAFYGNAKKPFKKYVVKLMKKFNVLPKETLILGDQLIMDILLANRLKIDSVLVQPIISVDLSIGKFNIFLEKLIYKRLERKNILHRGKFDDLDKFSEYELL